MANSTATSMEDADVGMPAPKPNIDTCHACGKLFPRNGIQLCTGCAMIDDNRFALVKAYVDDHDGAAITDIARGTGISMADVRKFLDGGRLVEFTHGSCTCGGIGSRCKACRAQLAAPFRDMEQAMVQEQAKRRADRGSGTWSGPDESGPRTSYVRRIRRIGDDL